MKKLLTFVLVLGVCAAPLVLVGCEEKKPEPAPANPPANPPK